MSLKSLHLAGVEKLYVQIDGPRPGNKTDLLKVKECIGTVISHRSNFQNLISNFSHENLGCGKSVTSGLDWFFSFEDRGIIVEDDILITKSFVQFAEEALDKFENDLDVWQINGWSPFNQQIGCNSVFRTRYANPWGWATWRNRWHQQRYRTEFAAEMKALELESNLKLRFDNKFDDYWNRNFNFHDRDLTPEWDYQWVYEIWRNGGFAISPPFRMTTNIGFGSDATHTIRATRFQLPRFEICKPWELEECKENERKDMLLGYALFPDSFSRGSQKSLFNQKILIEVNHGIKLPKSILRSIEIRGLFSQYLSVRGIKITVREFVRRLYYFARPKLVKIETL